MILGFLSFFKKSQATSPYKALNSVCLAKAPRDVMPPVHMTADTAARMCELICGTGFSLDRAKTVIYGVCTDCGGNV